MNIILSIMATMSYFAAFFVSVYAFVKLRQQQSLLEEIVHKLNDTHKTVGESVRSNFDQLNSLLEEIVHKLNNTHKIVMGESVRSNFDQLNNMKEKFKELLKSEQYEEAKKLKTIIDSVEKDVYKSLMIFKKECGGDIIEFGQLESNMKASSDN